MQRPSLTRVADARQELPTQENMVNAAEDGFLEGGFDPNFAPFEQDPNVDQHQQQYFSGWGEDQQYFGGMAGMNPGFAMGDEVLNEDYGPEQIGMPQQVPEGPCVAVPALSLRQPFASLVLYGVKQLEARNRPALKQLSGP